METLALVLAATAFGAMVFFAFAVAPLVFVKVPEADAGRFVRALFPVYYASGAALTLVAGVLAVGHWAGWLLLAIGAGFLLLRQVMMPAINRARDASLAGASAAGRRFDRLHRMSVWANGAQLVGLFTALVGLGRSV